MNTTLPRPSLFLATCFIIALLAQPSHAGILGFGNFTQWTSPPNQSDAASPPTPNIGSDSIKLTNQSGSEARSLFYDFPQDISKPFTLTVDYQAGNFDGNEYGGAAVVLQNDPRGLAALGGGAGSLGFGPNSRITNSVAITLELNGSSRGSGLYQNGNLGGGSLPIAPVDLRSSDLIQVTLTYDPQTHLLHENLLDTVTSAKFNTDYPVNLALVLGASTAYVGFTASTAYRVDQTFKDPAFTNAPSHRLCAFRQWPAYSS